LLRLSALPPAHDPFSPDNQRRLCHDAAEHNNEQIPPEFEFQELDVSGRKDRPRRGLDDALSLLFTRKVRTLYVAKLDRLTRRGMGHVGLILDELEKVGGRIVSSPTAWTPQGQVYGRSLPSSPSRPVPNPTAPPGAWGSGISTTGATECGTSSAPMGTSSTRTAD
jgi:hypothetical protein